MQHNEQEQLALLWTDAQPEVAAYVRMLVRDREDARDLLQQVAVMLVRDFSNYDPQRPFVAWAIGVAKNVVMSHLRKQAGDRHVFNAELASQLSDLAQSRDAARREVSGYESALDDCMGRLDDRGRECLDFYYRQGLKTATVAEKMAMSPGALRMLLCRVREALRECIESRLRNSGAE